MRRSPGFDGVLRAASLAAVLLGGSLPVMAQQRVGAATVVRNEVDRLKAGSSQRLNVGDNVFRAEVLQTGADSLAKLVLLDSTNLSLGPRARLTLDNYVLSGESTASKVTVRLVSGAFRFATGASDKRAYDVVTPTATIGIRGTVFQVVANSVQTVVTLEEGALTACTRTTPRRCISLTQRGDVAIITQTGASRGAPASGSDFASYCAAEPGLCTRTTFAEIARNPQAFAAALCGR